MEKEDVLVSVITASYNYENFIKETIESVLAQSYKNFEFIIVDDGSKDNSVEVIKSYTQKDQRIKLLTHENNSNKGLKETLLLGINSAKGKYIAFLESDDTILPNYLEKKLEIFEKYPNVALVFNDLNLFGCEEKIKGFEYYINTRSKVLNSKKYPTNISKEMRMFNQITTFSSVMVKTNVLKTLDFNSPIKPSLDYYLWLQVTSKFDVCFINEKLTNWRMHKDSYSKELTKPSNLDGLNLSLMKNKFILAKNPIKRALFDLGAWLLYFKKNIIKIHPKEGLVVLFGKKFKF